jgi:hypothetical protein
MGKLLVLTLALQILALLYLKVANPLLSPTQKVLEQPLL